MARQYAVTFSAVAITAAQDLFEVTAAAAGVVRLVGIAVGQYSDPGDAQAEQLSLTVVRGYTTSGSSSAFTPLKLNSGDPAAAAASKMNSTTVANTGTAEVLWADVWNVQAGYQVWWPPENRPTVRNSERIVVRITAPADSITTNGTLLFEEE